MQLSRFLTSLAGAFLLGACADSVVPFEPAALETPAQQPATGPRLSGGSGAPLYLSWMEESEDGDSLRVSHLEDDGWSPATTVVDGVKMFVNWADMPSVQPMGGDRLAAHWLEMSADMTYAYDVVFVQSADNGETWSAPMRPHSDGTPTEHGFVSMYRDDTGTGLIWLDGRKMVNEGTDDPVATGMTLRSASIDPDSRIHKEQLVDELICDCCQTDIAIAASGPVAVYRDRSPAEIRDITVTRLVDGQWQPGRTIAGDNWKIPGCPVNGPSITADGDLVAVAWFTGAGGQPTVKLSFSNDSGETFSDAILVATGGILGRVGLVFLTDGEVAVSWLKSSTDGGNEILARRYAEDGPIGGVRTVARSAGSFSVPQMAKADGDLVFVWTETDDRVNSIHSAKVPLEAL